MAYDPLYFDSNIFDTIEPFGLNWIKDTVRDAIRSRLMPEYTDATVSYDLVTDSTLNIDVAQKFMPFSTGLTSSNINDPNVVVSVRLSKSGTPDQGVVISLIQGEDEYPSTSTLSSYSIPVDDIPTSMEVVSCTLSLPEYGFIPKNEYWLKISPQCTPSTADYFTVYTDEDGSGYWLGDCLGSTISGSWDVFVGDIYFVVDVPDFIHSAYPREELRRYSFPRLIIDVTGRPRTRQPYLDHRLMVYEINLSLIAQATYPDLVDTLLSYADRALFEVRTTTDNIELITPRRIFVPRIESRNLYSRIEEFEIVYRMYTG